MIIRFTQKGMTLIEITVVLLVLVALAGLTVPYVSGISRKALCDATDVSMANIKRAIMDRYYLDTLGSFPQDLNGLTVAGTPKYNLHYLFSNTNLGGSRTHKVFDPDTATGWRSSGYLQGGVTLENDLSGTFSNSAYTDPFKQGHIVSLDAWGNPIIFQVPSSGKERLVSAGSNKILDTKIINNSSDNDRVLYLQNTPVGEQNTPCSD